MLYIMDSWFIKSPHNVGLLQHIREAGHEYRVVKLIPFSQGELGLDFQHHPNMTDADFQVELASRKDVFVWGRSSIKALSAAQGWNPGYYDPNLSMTHLFESYPGYCLNEQHITTPIKNLTSFFNEGDYHIRPVNDDKVFAGTVGSAASIRQWAKSIVAMGTDGYATVTGDTQIVVSPFKKIHTEYRLHVIQGQIITGSLYVRDGILAPEAGIPDTITQFAETLLRMAQPNEAFVMDIAQLQNGELKVIEFNAISGAGLYLSDQASLVGAIGAWVSAKH